MLLLDYIVSYSIGNFFIHRIIFPNELFLLKSLNIFIIEREL